MMFIIVPRHKIYVHSCLTLYDPIYFIGATKVGTFLLSSKLNNTLQVIEQNIIQIFDYTALNKIFTVYFHSEIKRIFLDIIIKPIYF